MVEEDYREGGGVSRKDFIGGSEAAAALGLSKRKSALQLYLEKRGESPPMLDNAWLRWGRILEPVVRQEYAEQTGREVRLTGKALRHAKYPFIAGHPDGGTDDGRLYEGKTARTAEGFGEPGTDQVPQDYLVQVQHYLLITGLSVADLAVLIGNCDFRIYEIPADKELQAMIMEGEAAFWQRVEKEIPPEPQWESPTALDTLKHLYPGTNGHRLVATPAQEAWRRVFDDAMEKKASYEKAADAAKAHLAWDMQDAASLAFADGKAFRRKLVNKKAYTVEAMQYLDIRLINDKE